MGRLLGAAFAGAGHTVRTLDTGDWDHAQNLLGDADAAVIAVPIDATAVPYTHPRDPDTGIGAVPRLPV